MDPIIDGWVTYDCILPIIYIGLSVWSPDVYKTFTTLLIRRGPRLHLMDAYIYMWAGECAYTYPKNTSKNTLSIRHRRGQCSLRHPSRIVIVHHSWVSRIQVLIIDAAYILYSRAREFGTFGGSWAGRRRGHFPICTYVLHTRRVSTSWAFLTFPM